jgi:hypothetical protein
VQRFCKPKVGGSNPSAGTIPLRFASRLTYPQVYARIRSRICESAEKFRLDSQAIPAHIQSVVPIFGSKPWSPGNFGFRGFLVSGVLAEPRELRFRGFLVSGDPACQRRRSPSKYFSEIFDPRGTRRRDACSAYVVQIFGCEPWSPGYFGIRGLLVCRVR